MRGVWICLCLCGVVLGQQSPFTPIGGFAGSSSDGPFSVAYEAAPAYPSLAWEFRVTSHLRHSWDLPVFAVRIKATDVNTGRPYTEEIKAESHLCDFAPEKTCSFFAHFATTIKDLSVESVGFFGESAKLSDEEKRALRVVQKTQEIELAKQQATEKAERATSIREELRIEATCHHLYIVTANKRVSDLTVLQTKQVQACTALGYYER